MLPLVVSEKRVFIFKFWFNERLQDGMFHQNELFCRLQTFNASDRAQVYHLGCQLAQQNTPTVISVSQRTCSLWTSLRSPLTKTTLIRGTRFALPRHHLLPAADVPAFEQIDEETSP